ncbi:hypothetical protein NQ314_004578 [Rhamnusium bicolor]|uniref:UBA domain-containing protein n=1 Tax=Rhamnusium bicolor TaxID=1586634 RepID=A0AAV8ZKU9_9CUCU|nr:hypothetical protein NQ314_004578 [Rhamnusium bicolor]
MLEGLVAWVLNNYLGKYVQLNTEQLSIALLSGLPVVIKAGFIGKVQLQVPLRQIRSAPWVIAIEQLYLVASPLPIHEWDHEAEELVRHELKLSALDTLEAKWRLEKDIQDSNSTYYASSYSSWYSYGAGLVSEIIENLQLKIQDVHIRYEDSVSIPGQAVAFGVTIESLTAQSCDSTWLSGFVHTGNSEESFKLLELQNFGVYWMMLKEDELLSGLSVAKLAEAMCPNRTKKHTKNYIVPSVSAQAHIKRNRSTQPLRSSTPRIVCDLLLEEVPLTLVDWQYNQIVTCVRGLDDIARLRNYRQYKPSLSIKEDAKAWWLYAISCFYPGKQPAICRPKPTWESCLQRARDNVKYVKICQKLLITPTVALTSDEKIIKENVEWSREYDELGGFEGGNLNLNIFIAMRSVKLPELNPNNGKSTGRNMLVSWFPTWMGWYSSTSSPESSISSSQEASQLEGEILQVLADSAENNTILKRDAVFGHFNFCLKRGTLNLCTAFENESSPMLELEFKNLSLNVLSKPRTSSHLVEISLDAVFLKDKITQNTMFPILMGPPGNDRTAAPKGRGPSPRISISSSKLEEGAENLFYLAYEKKPPNSGCDYRLSVKSKCLDVVYQPNAVKWLTEFICLPHQRDITQSRIEAMKSRTKRELIKNWEQILEGRVVARTSWELELDISAPQIIFVEQFTDENSAMAVIDFGRLQLRNNTDKFDPPVKAEFITKESEDDEMFLTPCSTPPASEASDSGEQTLEPVSQLDDIPDFHLNESNFHQKLYDCYFLELAEMQILIGKAKDNWRYALNKGSSNLHVLDRFNISLQIERRVVHTSDPSYPSVTLNANLPKLTVHLNENKIMSARNLVRLVTTTGLPSPFKSAATPVDVVPESDQEEMSESLDTSIELSRLLMVQFTIDQMLLEVQSRGRCIAELQVVGVKVAFTKRVVDISITLTVHSLLLVDALQTFGPDFELLVASHKHVGMDSMSGSLRDSEPTSPISPGSPDPTIPRASTTSPVALTQALSSLSTSPPLRWPGILKNGPLPDAEALITIEVVLVTGQEPVQIANIQFNNLDIIANQETIVELMGFIRRVFPKSQKPMGHSIPSFIPSSVSQSAESLLDDSSDSHMGTTELTFDFHRLNVLLLRGVVKDGCLYGKKICTATMSEAKIQATVSGKLEVEGSLGGLQVLDLTPEGHMHQRIVTVGRDPLLDAPHPIYMMSVPQEDNRTAFSFKIIRNLKKLNDKDSADIIVRMASLWYTHSPQFVVELQSCATEFKQYLSNLARSIRTAATDMALGLVHARAEALAQSLNMNKRLPGSIYGSALSFSESASPNRRRRRSSSNEPSGYTSAKDTIPQTPYSPADDDDFIIDLKLDIELDSPVVVLPRSSNSTQVFVAHLGKINVTNNYPDEMKTNGFHYEYIESRVEHYDIEVRNMNIYSLETNSRRNPGPTISRPEVMYNCKTSAKPILHDTMLQLNIDREINKFARQNSESNLLLDEDENLSNNYHSNGGLIQISGSIVTALKVSLMRAQYEQVLDTLEWLTSSPKLSEAQGISRLYTRPQAALTDINEEDTGVTTLNMDPHVRAKLFPSVSTVPKSKSSSQNSLALKISFELPIFTIELRGDTPTGEQGLVDLSFRDFVFNYEKCHKYETNIQVSLRSIFMEDLLQPEGCKQRAMVISLAGGDAPPNTSCVSRSCPDVTYHPQLSPSRGSLPDHLETARIFGMGLMTNSVYNHINANEDSCPCTPPPSPSQGGRNRPEKNLVIISTLLVDPSAPNFQDCYNGVHRSTSVDFNCLDLVISVKSWVVVIDFFSASPSGPVYSSTTNLSTHTDGVKSVTSKEKAITNITVRSLTVVLVKPDRDIAKANISNIEFVVKTVGMHKEVEGKLGSMSLQDLTLHGQLYRERFITSGEQALQFKYVRHPPYLEKNYDVQLTLDMASVMYVHTKRFIAEISAFFNKFTEKQQAVMKGIQAATSGQLVRDEPLRLSLILKVGSPIILLPVSSKSSDLLIVDLGQLMVTNVFKFSGDPGTISVVSEDSSQKCLLDVMTIELENMDLYTGIKGTELSPQKKQTSSDSFKLGIPDMSIYGQLSTLDGALDLRQYRLIRGLLAFNLGENTERINPSVPAQAVSSETDFCEEWKIFSIKLDMQNVTVQLLKSHSSKSPLTCINFIKSHLTVETFSNLCQDIDLVSQEILIMDTRFHGVDPTECCNVFTNILQPIKYSKENDLVQAEVHSRKRQDYTKVTVLLNDMRLMAIFDWWLSIKEYIFQEIENVPSSPEHRASVAVKKQEDDVRFDLKLNITDSEIVLVENSSQWDTSASTTVLKYRPYNLEKILSCSLNNLEMFSCILGMEDETALSIIDPITLNIDINKENVLEVQLQVLIVRLSYHDMRMFMQMLNSLPKQMVFEKSDKPVQSSITKSHITTLSVLGFKTEDCIKALEKCENRLDDAAIWLTRNATPSSSHVPKHDNTLSISAVEIKANRISICIIDDCGDSDVPLLELSFSDVQFYQLFPELNISDPINPQGSLQQFPNTIAIHTIRFKNETGSPLRFTTHISDMEKSTTPVVYKSEENWITVVPGETVPFSFTSRDKMRHQDSHKMRMHQLGVKIEGWQCIEPVTVDKVGIYFRDAPAEIQNRSLDLPPVRIVFDVALEGSARKLVTVRSALLIINNLPQTVEVKLESRLPHDAVTLWVPSKSFTINIKGTLAVPLVHAHSQINIRPCGFPHQYTFCMPPLNWTQMPSNVDRIYELATCHSHKGHNYRFCAEIIKENILISLSTRFEQPAHRIVLLPTVKLENLLPLDIYYSLSGEQGHIKAGASTSVTTIDPEKTVELGIKIENFQTCNAIVIPSGCNTEFSGRIKLEDRRQRKLYLLADISLNKGAKFKITISAYYWIINRTGLPLVFRQSGASTESAGQFDEHEQARMIAPVLFSFSDQDASPTINARLYCVHDSDQQAQKTSLKAMPNSHMPFHWSRLEKEQLLCVSISDIPDCCWSGGLKIDTNNSMHVNVRDANGRVYFLRLEVVLQGATFFVVFTDADTMPPPIRVDNFSEVAVTFGQSCCVDLMHSMARAHSSVPYAWDEPTKIHTIRLIAPRRRTFKNSPNVRDTYDVERQELVLDVLKNKVILAHKIPGERSQLWRMTTEGHLQHEGSSPPSHPNQPRKPDNILVLDIENTAPQPNTYSRLILRRIDPRRQSTQKWRFTKDGRLCNAVVLGLPQPICHKLTDMGIPIEQAIERQRLRPGSGFLTVNIHMDGPTQVISIKDLKEKRVYASPDDREWGTISFKQRPNLTINEDDKNKDSRELQFGIQLKGLGVSVVCRKTPQELLYAHFTDIVGETVITSQNKQFCISVKNIQVDNQLLDTSVPVVLYVTPPSSRNNDEAYDYLPALDFNAELQQKVNANADIFKEEELINKYEHDYETQRLLTEVSAAHAKRYYFGILKLIPDQIRLSVKTASKLPKHLQRIKRKLGLTLIKFEDAAVDLEAFERKHPFETREFLFKSIVKHFKEELMWQAGIILGSVDFIGNPLGLMNDVSEGLSGFIYEGNVGALVKNVTHGMSNSAAKITESLSDGLGRVTMDDYHEEMRQRIRQVESGKSSDHILAGFKGLGFGILGGATGIFKQVYEGASNDGLQGAFSGLGKGIVGAVTKPVVGVLDFASETARAVRDSSRSKTMPERIRLPRCVHGPGGLLPRYNLKQSQGQQYLYMVNDKNYEEQLIAYQVLGSASENLLCIVSNRMIRIVTSTRTPDLTPVIECPLR